MEEQTKGKPIRCKAAVCWNPGEVLVIEEIEVAPPQGYEVRIKVICTSLCHSDITYRNRKDLPLPFPLIFGHEAVGVVESVGEGVDEVKEGDLVVPFFLPECGDCTDCKSPKSNLCTKVPFQIAGSMIRSGTTRFSALAGGRHHPSPIYQVLGVSSFSEYTVVDVANVVKIPIDLPPDMACLLSCGISTGVGGAWRAAMVEAGSTVVIFGLGTVGLAVAEGARIQGASKIIGVDLNPQKFELGQVYGLTDFINPKECGDKPVHEVVRAMTDGGADYCFECVGLASLMSDAFLSSRPELQLEGFITHEVSFQDINKAFDLMLQGECLRCIIRMDA
ncbi:alcohol dehydrogenase-like 7 isoform X2 [Amborella trichopoda]|uniref:alcohol dehydrogenase-like 7 isoform X2 n=1 Tax=Amborella trichopoda TaxID=13333 RepID=UPI0009BE80E0|nr:alcohol dehydrogenase-like 7 isoform X2 [Amborella trichopoda]|eukprot:XP_020529095.1 alcohol dehydrogenase-like 7 isoform X2 [Amborella trichopoda]